VTSKERFIKALRRERLDGQHVPHFELVFFLTMEAFGKIHPNHRSYSQWGQMEQRERTLHIRDMARLYVDTAKKYRHDAILVHPNPGDLESVVWLLNEIRDISGDEYYLTMHGDPTFFIPDGNNMMEFSIRLYEDQAGLKQEAQRSLDWHINQAEALKRAGSLIDGFTLCSDYALNANPFFTPEIFGDLIAPYLEKAITAYREMGFYSVKHTDGNINPILDQMVQCKPDAIHSVDPQGGMSLSDCMAKYGDRMTFIGNVNCGLLQTGTEEQAAEDVRRALREGMESGKGYIFGTSNCIYTGLPLSRYEMMLQIWEREGIYPF